MKNLYRVIGDRHNSKDKYIVGKLKAEGWKNNLPLSLVKLVNVTSDFELVDEVKIIYTTDSYQIRPKAIYKNNKGFYYKMFGSTEYLTEEEVKDMEVFLSKVKEVEWFNEI